MEGPWLALDSEGNITEEDGYVVGHSPFHHTFSSRTVQGSELHSVSDSFHCDLLGRYTVIWASQVAQW